MAFPFVSDNDESRRKLGGLAAGLTSEDLSLVTSYGWSVAALFAHMAWWDQRVSVLLHRWQERGVDESPVDSEMINEALKPLCHAMDPQAAVRLCLSSAERTDAALAALSPDLFARIQASSNHFRFNRALHRNDHINDIQTLVRGRQPLAGA
jgi:hypothetical protein